MKNKGGIGMLDLDREEFDEEDFLDYSEYEEEVIEDEKRKKTKKEVKAEIKVSKLMEKLEKLNEKLKEQKLSPMKRLLIENKLAIIETRLDRQIDKKQIIERKADYEFNKDMRYEQYNEELARKQAELDDIYEAIERQERKIERKMNKLKAREKDYKEINRAGQTRNPHRNARAVYQFDTAEAMNGVLKSQKNKLTHLKAQKNAKKEEIINFKKEMDEKEKQMDSKALMELKEMRPSIWRSFKDTFDSMADNFKAWRYNIKEE